MLARVWLQVSLASLRLLVLDEADKLFEASKGFLQQLDAIFAACAASRGLVRSLFSATLPEWVQNVAGSVLQDPAHVTVGVRNAACSNVQQSLLFVGQVSCSPCMEYSQPRSALLPERSLRRRAPGCRGAPPSADCSMRRIVLCWRITD